MKLGMVKAELYLSSDVAEAATLLEIDVEVLLREEIAKRREAKLTADPAFQAAQHADYYAALLKESDKKAGRLKFFLTPEAVELNLEPPKRAYKDDAGYDLRLLAKEPLVIPPHERRPIPTGVGFEIPEGWYGLICNRTSGGKRGLVPLAQVVDASFTGALTLTLHNTNETEAIVLEPGERVAQIVFMPTWQHSLEQILPSEIKKTDRGTGAYGSSGKY